MVALADEAVAILREACRAAEDLGMKIAMENHADFTVRELASILARVNSPAFGFTVDCANLAFDLDDPLRLAEIMAPPRLDDALQELPNHPHPDGLALENCALGDGDIDLAAIAELLGEAQSADQPEHRNSLASSPLSAGRLEPGLSGRGIRSPPGDGLAWYLAKGVAKAPPDPGRRPCPTARGLGSGARAPAASVA